MLLAERDGCQELAERWAELNWQCYKMFHFFNAAGQRARTLLQKNMSMHIASGK